MRTSLGLLGLFALSSVPVAQNPQAGARYEREGSDWIRVEPWGRFVVKPSVVSARLQEGLDFESFLERAAAADAGLAGLELVRSNVLGIHDLRLPAGMDVLDVRDRIQATGLVQWAEENAFGRYIGTPNDPDYSLQENLNNVGQGGGTVDADCDAELAWDLTTGSPDVVIAVLDSGTEFSHEDLAGNIWMNPGETIGNGIDDDNNGYIDDIVGWNFDDDTNQPDGAFFHGTFVAGIVGARSNNGVGIAALAGGWGDQAGCSLMLANVGSFSPNSDVLDDAILYAADTGAAVITMSLSVPSSQAITDAIAHAASLGVFIDCAAGNGFGGPVSFPATDANVVCVGGTDNDDNYWSLASVGPEMWVSALADNVYSADLNDGYGYSGGTSFAAPLVGACAGLILSVLPGAEPDDIAEILKLTADDVDAPGFDDRTGWGRLNAHQAVQLALASDCNGNGLYDPREIDNGSETDYDGNGTPDSCQPFSQDMESLSVSAGGDVQFVLDGPNFVSGQTYLVLGSASGTAPGIDFGGGLVLPLNFDSYMQVSISGAGGSVFVNTLGTLNGSGNGSATLSVPAGQNPGLAGLTIHHGFATVGGGSFVTYVSNSMPLLLDA